MFVGEEMQRGSAQLLDNSGRRGDGGGSRRRAAGAFGEESRGGRGSHRRGERESHGELLVGDGIRGELGATRARRAARRLVPYRKFILNVTSILDGLCLLHRQHGKYARLSAAKDAKEHK